MPENTVDQIPCNPDDEFSEMREATPVGGNLLQTLANALGISPAKVANALGGILPNGTRNKKLNAHCKCGKWYRYFSDEAYTEDQSVCPPCRDAAMAVEREAAMRPEKMAAQVRLREEAAKTAEKKNDERKELVTLVAETVAQLQKSKAA